MKLKEVKKWVEKNIDKYKKEYCLDTWIITLEFLIDNKNTEIQAQCVDAKPEYEIVTLKFWPDNISNEKDLEDTLRHELWHVVLSPLTYYERVLDKYLKPSNNSFYDVLFDIVNETLVRNLEKIEQRRLKSNGSN